MQVGGRGNAHTSRGSNMHACGIYLAPGSLMTPGAVSTPSRQASEFYRRVLLCLGRAGIDFLVGGAFAFVRYTGIDRETKDIDLFVRRRDWVRVSQVLNDEGFRTELTFSH